MKIAWTLNLKDHNKVLLDHNHAHSYTYCLRPHARYEKAKHKSYDEDRVAHEAWNIYYLALLQKSFPSLGSTIILNDVLKGYIRIIKFINVTKNNVNLQKSIVFL